MKHNYTYNELISEIKILRNTFDIVRVVDPIICKDISEEILKESDTVDKLMPELSSAGLTGKDGFCFNVWSNESRVLQLYFCKNLDRQGIFMLNLRI